MPNGFWYASGEFTMDERTAGSAFSQGDLLTLDASSNLSRLNPYAATTGSIFGVAPSDSTNSINGLCGVVIPGPDTLFWSRGTSGDTLIVGESSGVSFVAAAPGRYFIDESTTTSMVVVVKGTADVDQSVESKALVKFKYAAGELDLS